MKNRIITNVSKFSALCLITALGAASFTGCTTTPPVHELAARESISYTPGSKQKARISRRAVYFYSGPASGSRMVDAPVVNEGTMPRAFTASRYAPAPVGERVVVGPGSIKRSTTIYSAGRFDTPVPERGWNW